MDSAPDVVWAARRLRRVRGDTQADGALPCGGAMRIVAFVTAPAAVRRILDHLARRGVEARAGPWAGAAATPG